MEKMSVIVENEIRQNKRTVCEGKTATNSEIQPNRHEMEGAESKSNEQVGVPTTNSAIQPTTNSAIQPKRHEMEGAESKSDEQVGVPTTNSAIQPKTNSVDGDYAGDNGDYAGDESACNTDTHKDEQLKIISPSDEVRCSLELEFEMDDQLRGFS